MKFTLLFRSFFLLLAFTEAQFVSAQCGFNAQLVSVGAPCAGVCTYVAVTGTSMASSGIEVIDADGNLVASSNGSADTILSQGFGAYYASTFRAIITFNGCIDTTNGVTFVEPVSNAISISTAHDTLCSGGHNVTFTASATTTGTPVYQWMVNGAFIAATGSTYTGNFNNDDMVTCTSTITNECAEPAVAVSNGIKLTIDNNSTISITPDPVCLGATLFLNNASQADSITWTSNSGVEQIERAAPMVKIRAGNNQYGSAGNNVVPVQIYADSAGNLYVMDNSNERVMFFPAGSDSATLGVEIAGKDSVGGGNNRPVAPQGMCVDTKKNVFIVDQQLSGISRILEFPAGSTQSTDGIVVYTFASGLYPEQIASDGQDNLYVYETYHGNTLEFVPDGLGGYWCIGSIGNFGFSLIDQGGDFYSIDLLNQEVVELTPELISRNDQPIVVAGGNGQGSAANQFYYPEAITLDESGNLYVLDYDDGYYGARLQKFPPGSTSATNGVTVASAPSDGNSYVQHMAVDGQGNFYFSIDANYPVLGNVTEIFPGLTSIDTTYTPLLPGSYSAAVQTVAGCRNVTTAPDSVKPLSYTTIDTGICYGQTVTVAGITYDTVGFFNDTLFGAAASGCDSIINLQLSVNYAPKYTATIYPTNLDTNDIIGDTLVAYFQASGAYYFQWSLNGKILTNADSSDEIIVEAPGNYEVIAIGPDGCNSQPGYLAWGISGINTPASVYNFSIYPNPNNGDFTLKSENLLNATYCIYNMIGQCISQGMIISNNQNIQLNDVADGIYNLIIKDDRGYSNMRFTISK